MAEIACIRNDMEKAIFHLDCSLSANRLNINALGLYCTVLRHTGQVERAQEIIGELLHLDPLSHWAYFELYLDAEGRGRQNSNLLLGNFERLMRDQPESYLELATNYISSGFYEDAWSLLHLATGSQQVKLSAYPTIHYYLGYLKEQMGENREAHKYYEEAGKLPYEYCFPFRLESLKVFNSAIKDNPEDYRAWYYMGNILFDPQPDRAIEKWEKAVELEPSFAIAHRNLGWGYQYAGNRLDLAIEEYEKAIELDPTKARFYYELDRLYEENNTSLEKRLQILTSNHSYLSAREDALIREIMVLVLNRKYELAIRYLEDNFFHIQEGSRELHDVYVDAHLLRGISYLQSKDYQKALEDFLDADLYPLNHQVGRDPDYVRNAQIYYYTGIAYELAGDPEKGQAYYRRSVEQDARNTAYMFYQGKAYEKLNNHKMADELFKKLIAIGQNYLQDTGQADYFAKFGRGRSGRERKADAYYMLGLGYLGAGSKEDAVKQFQEAKELNKSHVWADLSIQDYE
jgi:tetratricopeptide (TPR) repeat protein